MTGVPQTIANPEYGIPTYYFPGNPWTGSSLIPFPNSPGQLFGGENTISSQEGVSVGTGTNYVTENMDGTGILNPNNNYYEYGFQVNWTGWKQVKVPVNYNPSTPSGKCHYSGWDQLFLQYGGRTNPTIVRTVRVWTTGASSTPISGDFRSNDRFAKIFGSWR